MQKKIPTQPGKQLATKLANHNKHTSSYYYYQSYATNNGIHYSLFALILTPMREFATIKLTTPFEKVWYNISN